MLDLIKAFNVVCRPFLQALMLRLGFQPIIVLAWFSCLQGLSRQALVAGAVYGTSHASTGIPEGDPLSVVGMFALCCLFREVVVSQNPLAFPFSYADNWEVVTGAPDNLMKVLAAMDRLSDICRLPIAPSKCWTWAFQRHVRRQLASCTLDGKTVPVRLTVAAWVPIWRIPLRKLLPPGMAALPVGIAVCCGYRDFLCPNTVNVG